MYNFSHEYKYFNTVHDDRISVTSVYSTGSNMGEMLTNIEVYAEDWHGNPVDMPFESLHEKDAAIIRADIAHFLHRKEVGEELGNNGEPIKHYPEAAND